MKQKRKIQTEQRLPHERDTQDLAQLSGLESEDNLIRDARLAGAVVTEALTFGEMIAGGMLRVEET